MGYCFVDIIHKSVREKKTLPNPETWLARIQVVCAPVGAMIREYGDFLHVPVIWCCTGIKDFHVANHLLQEYATSFWQFYDAVLAVFGGWRI